MNDGQTVLVNQNEIGIVSHYHLCYGGYVAWVKFMNGETNPIGVECIIPINPAVYDIVKGNYDN